MHRLNLRWVVSVVVAGCLVPAVAGCGGASDSAAILPGLEDNHDRAANVVQVAGAGGIGKAAVSHWIAIQAITDYKSRPTRPVPLGVVPDPPFYRNCIARLRAEPIGPNPQNPTKPKPKPTDANLKKECEGEYEVLRQHVLLILTSFRWLAGESARQGVKISDATVRKKLERLSREQFSSTAEFQEYMRNTEQSYQDEMLRTRMDLYTNELARVAGERAHSKSQRGAFEAYLRTAGATARRWAAKTTCAPGYVTQNCSNYKGSLEPELRV